jgi:hypothetical protein
MFSAWRDIITTKKRYSAFNPFGSHEQNLDPKIVLTRMRFNFASPAINSAAAEGMSETRSDPGVSNSIQTPSVKNCILARMSRETIGRDRS